MNVSGVSLEQVQVNEQARTSRARTACARLEMLLRKRVVEVVRAHLNTETAAANGHPAFEFVQTDVHAVVVQHFERRFEAPSQDRFADIPKPYARVLQKPAVGIVGGRA